jgi:hypothetical protein
MPESRIIAETGDMASVAGKRKERVAAGPIPGSTPMRVPATQPRKQKNKLKRN